MARFEITYATTALRERLPESIEADEYRLNSGFFIFSSGDELGINSTITHRLAAKTVLHIERKDDDAL